MGMEIVVRPDDGFDHWHHVTCRRYSLTECRPVPDRAFRASIAARLFGGLVLSDISSAVGEREQLRVVRGAAEIRQDGRDDFMLWLCLEGSTRFEQHGRCVELGPGDLMLHDQARPFVLEFGSRSHTTMVTIARPLLAARLPAVETLAARRVESTSPVAGLAAGLVRNCLGTGADLDEASATRLAASALDIWSTALEAALSPDARSTDRPRRRLEQAKQHMLAHLGDSEIDVEAIATAQNMSVRTLVRLFALEGETPMRWLWSSRLAASYRLLAERRVARVSDAALACGFRDMSHFSRAFRTRFARPPQEVLQGTKLS